MPDSDDEEEEEEEDDDEDSDIEFTLDGAAEVGSGEKNTINATPTNAGATKKKGKPQKQRGRRRLGRRQGNCWRPRGWGRTSRTARRNLQKRPARS